MVASGHYSYVLGGIIATAIMVGSTYGSVILAQIITEHEEFDLRTLSDVGSFCMDKKGQYFAAIIQYGNFILYLGLGSVILYVFSQIYIRVTPYNEIVEIKAGKKAPAIALVGAMAGFTLPLLVMSFVGVDLVDYLV